MAKYVKPRKLSPKQAEFVRQYFLCGRNASEAYRLAYPKCKNPNVNSAVLMANDSIRVKIEEVEKENAKKFDISREKLINETAAMAFADAGRLIEWSEEQRRFIARRDLSDNDKKGLGVTLDPDGGVCLKLLPDQKLKAIELLAKLCGHDSPQGTAGEMLDALKEAKAELERRQAIKA